MTDRHPFATRRGRKVRAAKLRADPLCQPCHVRGRVRAATQVHHIKPLSEGGAPYDWENLESVCQECHRRAHGARDRRVDPATGLPLDPEHWWNANR